MREFRSPNKIPVTSFKIAEALGQRLEKTEKRKRRLDSERVNGAREHL